MTNNLKIRSPWSQLAVFLGLLGLSLIVGAVAGSAILLARTGLSGARTELNLNDPAVVAAMKWAQILSTCITFGIPTLFYARQTFHDNPLQHLALRPAEKPIFYYLGIALLLFAFPLEGWLGTLNKELPLPNWMLTMEKENDRQVVAFLQVRSSLHVIINLFVVALLPAILEELCFRGALQRILIHIFKSPWTGIVIGAAFFSAFHMQFQGFLPRMLLGVLLGAAFWYSGSLWTSILAHFFFNGIQVIVASYYPKFMNDNPAIPTIAALLSLVIIVGLLLFMRRLSTARYDQVYNEKQAGEYDDFLSNQNP